MNVFFYIKLFVLDEARQCDKRNEMDDVVYLNENKSEKMFESNHRE